MRNLLLFIILALLSACDERGTLAPVVDGNWRAAQPSPEFHRVKSGDTLYSIAFRYDQDYRRLASINQLHSPYLVKIGQVIRLKSYHQRSFAHQTGSRSSVSSKARPKQHSAAHWLWPLRGAVLSSFAPQRGRKGIEIAGKKGAIIRASANGVVAYAGDGLPGYGNLLLIQHSKQLLSAYGYNARNLVRAGQAVHAGQPIALVGRSPQRQYAMHFEIRKAGQPVNPDYYLR